MKLTIQRNEECNGVELYFDERPAQSVIDRIKAIRTENNRRAFFYHRKKKCWYAKATAITLGFVKELNTDPIPAAANEASDATREAIWAEFGQQSQRTQPSNANLS